MAGQGIPGQERQTAETPRGWSRVPAPDCWLTTRTAWPGLASASPGSIVHFLPPCARRGGQCRLGLAAGNHGLREKPVASLNPHHALHPAVPPSSSSPGGGAPRRVTATHRCLWLCQEPSGPAEQMILAGPGAQVCHVVTSVFRVLAPEGSQERGHLGCIDPAAAFQMSGVGVPPLEGAEEDVELSARGRRGHSSVSSRSETLALLPDAVASM